MEFGVYGRILFCGQLEKRRDGALRGGWSSRLFLLTPDSIHYFRRITDQELLGEERGFIHINDITSVRAMPEDDAPISAIEIGIEHYYLVIHTEPRSYLMRVPVAEASTCESWSIAIEEQRKSLRAEKVDQNYENVLLIAQPQEASPPRIAMISVVSVNEKDSSKTQQEIVIKRKVMWGEVLDLGVISQGGACVILLQDGSIGRIGTQALMGSWDAGQTCWIEVVNAENPTEIEVSVACKVLSQGSSATSLKTDANLESSMPKWLEWVDEGSSIGFLLMCLFVHLLYGVDGFHWSHKVCLTVGAALAITTILNGPSTNKPLPTTSHTRTPRQTKTNQLPKLQFSLTVHRCRIKMEGTEVIHPSDTHKLGF